MPIHDGEFLLIQKNAHVTKIFVFGYFLELKRQSKYTFFSAYSQINR